MLGSWLGRLFKSFWEHEVGFPIKYLLLTMVHEGVRNLICSVMDKEWRLDIINRLDSSSALQLNEDDSYNPLIFGEALTSENPETMVAAVRSWNAKRSKYFAGKTAPKIEDDKDGTIIFFNPGGRLLVKCDQSFLCTLSDNGYAVFSGDSLGHSIEVHQSLCGHVAALRNSSVAPPSRDKRGKMHFATPTVGQLKCCIQKENGQFELPISTVSAAAAETTAEGIFNSKLVALCRMKKRLSAFCRFREGLLIFA